MRKYGTDVKWTEEESPEEYQPSHSNLPDDEVSIPEVIDVQDSPITKQELMDIGQQTMDAPELVGYGEEGPIDSGMIYDAHQHGRMWPDATFVINGALICDRITEIPVETSIDATYSTYYIIRHMLANGFNYGLHADRVAEESIHLARDSRKEEYMGQDILDGFDPSRIHRR